jgi:hypothetical protein
MGNQMVPFEQMQLPAYLQGALAADADDLIAGTGGGFPVASIKGKVFTIRRGDEKQIVTRPDGSGEPASGIDVVIIRANPSFSKNFYEKGFREGDEEKPDCYSNDGIKPEADAGKPQSQTCAVCPHNQWGSRISEQGSKGKACADSRKLAIAAAGAINDPMLLRVPAASLKTLGEYGKLLKTRGVSYPIVVTRISFDPTAAHPALIFKPVSFLQQDTAQKVAEMKDSDIVQSILGMGPQLLALPAPSQPAAQPVAMQAPVVQQPVVAQPTPVVKPVSNDSLAFGGVSVAGGAATLPTQAAPVAAAPVKQAQAVVIEAGPGDDMAKKLAAVLGQAGFDDQA